jgi:hypothetical protein
MVPTTIGFSAHPQPTTNHLAWDVPDPPSAHGGPATAPAPGGPAITWPASQDAAKAGAAIPSACSGSPDFRCPRGRTSASGFSRARRPAIR